MITINIGHLKAKLSAHIQKVREGEEVIVCERNKPVARIVPWSLQPREDEEKELIASGALLPPRKRRRTSPRKWPPPPGNLSDAAVKQLWLDERGDR
jgi:prevent-host-death family protein